MLNITRSIKKINAFLEALEQVLDRLKDQMTNSNIWEQIWDFEDRVTRRNPFLEEPEDKNLRASQNLRG